MSRNVLLILSDAAEAKTVRRSLVDSRDGPFKVEWVNRCGDAIKRLGSQGGEEIAAVVVDLFLPDSQESRPSSSCCAHRPTYRSWS